VGKWAKSGHRSIEEAFFPFLSHPKTVLAWHFGYTAKIWFQLHLPSTPQKD
jgi:hypothetical protein